MISFLDTCVAIDALGNRAPHYRQRIEEAISAPGGIVISSFVLHELVYGAMISRKPEMELSLVDGFVERAQVEPWTAEDAIAAARVRVDLRLRGASINAVDSLIAGQALNRGWPVVTSNIKDFIRVPGLEVIDWSDPAGPRRIDPEARREALLRRFKEEK